MGLEMSTFPGLRVSAAIMVSYLETLGLHVVYHCFNHSSGSATAAKSHSPKLSSLARPSPGEQEGRKNPGGRGVSSETGLGGNVTNTALTAVTGKLRCECAFSVIIRVLSDILAGEVL
jgi:hypothetical protein